MVKPDLLIPTIKYFMNKTTKVVIALILVLALIGILFVSPFKLQSTSSIYVYNATGTGYRVSFIKSTNNSFTYCSDGSYYINPGEALNVTNYGNQQINVYSGSTFVALLLQPSNSNVYVIGGTTAKPPSAIVTTSLSNCSIPNSVTVYTKSIGSLSVLTDNITFGYQCNACLSGGSCGAFSSSVPNDSQETFSNLPYCTTGLASGGLFQYSYKKSTFTFTCNPPSPSSGAYSYSTTLTGTEKVTPTVATKGNYTVSVTFDNCVDGTQYSASYGSTSKQTCTCSNGSCSVTITTGHPSVVDVDFTGQNIPITQYTFDSEYIPSTCTLYKCTFNYTQNGQTYTGTTYQTSPCPSGDTQTTVTINSGQTVTYTVTYRAENSVSYVNGVFTGDPSSLVPLSYVPTMGGSYVGSPL